MVETDITKRWEEGIDHHPKSIELMDKLIKIDYEHCGDHFCWKTGGDGDNGETLMYEMDIYFEQQDVLKSKEINNIILKTHNDGKEKYQSFEAYISTIDCEKGYGRNEKEAIEEYRQNLWRLFMLVNNAMLSIKDNSIPKINVDCMGEKIK